MGYDIRPENTEVRSQATQSLLESLVTVIETLRNNCEGMWACVQQPIPQVD